MLGCNTYRRRNPNLGQGLWKDFDQRADVQSGLLITLFFGGHQHMRATLTSIIEEWFGEREIGQKRRAQLHYSARNFAKYSGTLDAVALGDAIVNGWLRQQLDEGRSPRTVRSNRCNLLTIWTAAFERGYIDLPPRRVRKVSLNRIIPRCWTHDEFEAVLASIERVRGVAAPGAPKGPWLRALCLVGLSTGLRKGDLLALRRGMIRPDGSLTVVQNKTGDAHTARLGVRAREALAAMPSHDSPLLFPWVHREDAFTKMFRRLVDRAGLPGSFKWIRRCGATWIAAKHGKGAASQYLGHRSPELAELNYIDPAQLCPDAFVPDAA